MIGTPHPKASANYCCNRRRISAHRTRDAQIEALAAKMTNIGHSAGFFGVRSTGSHIGILREESSAPELEKIAEVQQSSHPLLLIGSAAHLDGTRSFR